MAEDTRAGQKDQATQGLMELEGKYLTFRLAEEEYGIPILTVVEIIKMMEVTPVPRTPSYVRGVINLRGRVIPVVELREKFGMPTTADTSETCIIVVKVHSVDGDLEMGIIIDTVSEVLDIAGRQIEPPPQFGAACETDFILGMAKAGTSVKILIDINRILGGEEIAALAG